MDKNDEAFSPTGIKRIGYWVTERKFRRLNFETLEKVCRYCSCRLRLRLLVNYLIHTRKEHAHAHAYYMKKM